MYNEGDQTPLGMTLNLCNLRRCWTECLELADYERRKSEAEEWNRKNRYPVASVVSSTTSHGLRFIKKGIYVVPTKYGVGFGFKGLSQGGALVHIYKDGSVLVTAGGMEMGQGLYTKLVQVHPVTAYNRHKAVSDCCAMFEPGNLVDPYQ